VSWRTWAQPTSVSVSSLKEPDRSNFQLADYTTAKAGLLAFHSSLTAELRYSEHQSACNIKTVLVAPGQLGTAMFAGVKTPSNFLAPIMEPVELARRIVQMIDDGESGEIRSPFYASWIPVLGALPAGVQALLRRWSGLDRAMQHYSKWKQS
jgi:short-subunit dehydrogenase